MAVYYNYERKARCIRAFFYTVFLYFEKSLLYYMYYMRNQILTFSKRKQLHVTRPPRLEGKVKNAMMKSAPKKKSK